MARKSQSLVQVFYMPEKVAGNFQAKCKCYSASVSTKSTSNLPLHLKVKLITAPCKDDQNTTGPFPTNPKARQGLNHYQSLFQNADAKLLKCHRSPHCRLRVAVSGVGMYIISLITCC